MATNWRLTKKEVAIIAQALKNIRCEDGDFYGYNHLTQDEINKLSARFVSSAEVMREQKTASHVNCSCKDCA